MKEFPPFRLDPVNQALWRVGDCEAAEQVALAPKAFDLLSFLVDNPGRLVTHEELLDTLWPRVHVHPEVIKSQILAVRQALGDDVRAPRFVETVRGRGYRFVAPIRRNGIGLVENAIPAALTLVGRAAPLAELQEQLLAALAGDRQFVFVTGEPGIGKTTLIETFLHSVPGSPTILLARGQCVEGFGGTEPYYPMLEALEGLCASTVNDSITQQLVSLAPSWAMQLPAHIPLDRRNLLHRDIVGAGRERMLREICYFLEVISAAQPLLLVFEDLHWADYSTVDLVSALARRRSPARLMIIGSYRTEDVGSDLHPIKQVSHALALRKLCHEIELAPLEEDQISEYLAGGDPAISVPMNFVSLIKSQSGGNPLFMTATLDHLAERGLLEQRERAWWITIPLDQLELRIPDTLIKVIEARIFRLTRDQCTVLQAAAIAGATFRSSVAAAAIDKAVESFEDICEELSRLRMFIRRDEMRAATTEIAAATYSFRHELYRQVFYSRQGPIRRALGHQKIGISLEASCPARSRSEIAAELVRHFSAAEDWPRALIYLRMALQTAKQRFANQEAMEILDQSMSVVTRLPDHDRPGAELALLEARAAIFMVEHDPRATRAYENVVETAQDLGDFHVQARALLGLAYAVGWCDQTRAQVLLDQAVSISEQQLDSQSQARTQVSAYAWKVWIGGWSDEAVTRCWNALARLQESDDPVAAAWASLEASMVYLLASRYREALELVKTGYQQLHLSAEAQPEYSLERAVWSYFLGVPLSFFLLGEFGNALEAYDNGIALFTKNGNRYAVCALRLYRAWLMLHCGDYNGVIAECTAVLSERTSEDLHSETGPLPPAEQRLAMLLKGLASIGRGEHPEALQLLSEVDHRMKTRPVIFDWYWKMPLERGLTNIAVATGRITDARVHADKLVSLACSGGELMWQGLAWDTRARVALLEGDYDDAIHYVEKARSTTDGRTTPLADWQILATAAEVYMLAGDSATAETHAAACGQERAKLAASLPDASPLRSCLMKVSEFGRATGGGSIVG